MNEFDFKGKALQEAIRLTFQNRETDIPRGEPAAFSMRFAQEKQGQWSAFLKTGGVSEAPGQFTLVTKSIQDFIQPVFDAILEDVELQKNWVATEKWK